VLSPTFDAPSDFVTDVRAEEQSQQKDDEQGDTEVVADFLEYIVGVQRADVLTGVDSLGHQGVRNRHVLGSCHRANMRATVTPTPSKMAARSHGGFMFKHSSRCLAQTGGGGSAVTVDTPGRYGSYPWRVPDIG